jgi:hypothetical protein
MCTHDLIHLQHSCSCHGCLLSILLSIEIFLDNQIRICNMKIMPLNMFLQFKSCAYFTNRFWSISRQTKTNYESFHFHRVLFMGYDWLTSSILLAHNRWCNRTSFINVYILASFNCSRSVNKYISLVSSGTSTVITNFWNVCLLQVSFSGTLDICVIISFPIITNYDNGSSRWDIVLVIVEHSIFTCARWQMKLSNTLHLSIGTCCSIDCVHQCYQWISYHQWKEKTIVC